MSSPRILGHRRFGHNEGDEPITPSQKCIKTKTHPTTRQIYATQLERGVIEKGGGDQLVAEENKS